MFRHQWDKRSPDGHSGGCSVTLVEGYVKLCPFLLLLNLRGRKLVSARVKSINLCVHAISPGVRAGVWVGGDFHDLHVPDANGIAGSSCVVRPRAHARTHAQVRIYTRIHACMHCTRTHIFIGYTRTHNYTGTHTHLHACAHTRTHARERTHARTHARTHTHTRTRARTHTHTHTH